MENPQDKKLVLLVEDNASIRELYAMAFIHAGIKVLMAEHGEQGLRLALEHHPALILLDLDMPIMDGYQMSQAIREDEWGQNAQIIFLTNRDDAKGRAHVALSRPQDYIVKSDITVKEVVNKVLIAIGEKPVK